MTSVLISGASVAGPATAYWLNRYGFDVTIVERAPALRGGGYPVDFRGPTHLGVLDKMDVLPALQAVATGGSPYAFVDGRGRGIFDLPGEFAGGDIEIERSDLASILHSRTEGDVEYLFGDSIAKLDELGSGVRVSFESGRARQFDLVIGADGLHSNVRKLVLGPESSFVRFLGYYISRWDFDNTFEADRTAISYNERGRLVSVSSKPRSPSTATSFLVFAEKRPLSYDHRDVEAQKDIVRRRYEGMGWRSAEVIASLEDGSDFYFDSISRVSVDQWHHGRVALVGDAAYGATVGGMGVGMAVVGAYVLAGELALAQGDYSRAFARYSRELRSYVRECQKGGRRTGQFLAPATSLGLLTRNTLLRSPFVMKQLVDQAQTISSDMVLQDYPRTVAARSRSGAS